MVGTVLREAACQRQHHRVMLLPRGELCQRVNQLGGQRRRVNAFKLRADELEARRVAVRGGYGEALQQLIFRLERVNATPGGEEGGGIVRPVGIRREQGEAGIDFVAAEQRIGAGKGEGEGFLRVDVHAAGVGVCQQAEIGSRFGCRRRCGTFVFRRGRGDAVSGKGGADGFHLGGVHAVGETFGVVAVFARESAGVEVLVKKGQCHQYQADEEVIDVHGARHGYCAFPGLGLLHHARHQVLLHRRGNQENDKQNGDSDERHGNPQQGEIAACANIGDGITPLPRRECGAGGICFQHGQGDGRIEDKPGQQHQPAQ